VNDPVTWGAVISVGGIIIAWLLNKLWRAYRHEINGLKGTDANLMRLVNRLDEEIKKREQGDRERWESATREAHDRHDEVLAQIGELAAAVAELRGRIA
jgi:uncharacterized protein YdcH (DUF465 family)